MERWLNDGRIERFRKRRARALPASSADPGGGRRRGRGLGRRVFLGSRTLLALIGLVALHMAVNILNEWSDMRTGIDLETERTPFSGGSGTLPAGGMGSRTALVFGLVCSGVGLAIGLWFLWKVGWVLLPIMLAGAVSVLAYTDVLARIGVGEIAAGFGLGAGPVIGAALVQGGGWSDCRCGGLDSGILHDLQSSSC